MYYVLNILLFFYYYYYIKKIQHTHPPHKQFHVSQDEYIYVTITTCSFIRLSEIFDRLSELLILEGFEF